MGFDKFMDANQGIFLPPCNFCRHKLVGLRCKAFTEIPKAILVGDIPHLKPLKNQGNNKVFWAVKSEMIK